MAFYTLLRRRHLSYVLPSRVSFQLCSGRIACTVPKLYILGDFTRTVSKVFTYVLGDSLVQFQSFYVLGDSTSTVSNVLMYFLWDSLVLFQSVYVLGEFTRTVPKVFSCSCFLGDSIVLFQSCNVLEDFTRTVAKFFLLCSGSSKVRIFNSYCSNVLAMFRAICTLPKFSGTFCEISRTVPKVHVFS